MNNLSLDEVLLLGLGQRQLDLLERQGHDCVLDAMM